MNNLVLENFKCFQKQEIETKKLNILCGVNSGGKSSVIQGYLLTVEALNKAYAEGTIDLMQTKYNMNLHSFDEIYFEDSEEEHEKIRIKIFENDGLYEVIFTSEEGDNNVKYMISTDSQYEGYDKGVWYLSSERYISDIQMRGNADNLLLGNKNEYLGFILERGRSAKIDIYPERSLELNDNKLFAIQVNEWLNQILPGNRVQGEALNAENIVSMRFGKEFQHHKTNIGYGVSFVLPIIVSGLLAKKGDILIVENPELHLHPKAQSELMAFFVKISLAGVQVILETHSDHIVNGMRKAIVNDYCALNPDDVRLYFFDDKKKCQKIEINENADLETWPEDFMDQGEQDLCYIRKHRKRG